MLLGVGEDRFELVLLPPDPETELAIPYELSDSVPELIRFDVEIVFLGLLRKVVGPDPCDLAGLLTTSEDLRGSGARE